MTGDLQLRPFQDQGVDTLLANDRFLLADDMGAGKTVQLLKAAVKRFTPPRVIWVTPPSLKYSCRDECLKWAPELRPVVMQGLGLGRFKWPSPGELVIIGYNQLPDWLDPPPAESGYPTSDQSPRAKRRRRELKAQREKFNEFLYTQEPLAQGVVLVYDEAQSLKAFGRSAVSRKARILSKLCHVVWPATGTPMPRGEPEDNYGILWACQMEGIVFDGYNDYRRCAGHRFVDGKWVPGTPTPLYHKKLSRFMVRRKMEEISDQCPERIYSTLTVDLADQADRIFEGIDPELIAAIRRCTTALELERLRGMPGFYEFSMRRKELARALIPAMLDYVDLMESNGVRTVVASAHKEPILALASRPGWACIHGDDGGAEYRQQIVQEQENYFGVGLTIRSGGAGLNLRTFTNMLYVDLDWDLTQNQQVERRIIRLDSDARPRTYTTLLTDSAIHRLVTSKQLRAMENINIAIEGRLSS